MNESHLMTRVAQMYLKFGYSYMGPPRVLSQAHKSDRIKMMQEELDEFSQANTHVEHYDAILDLMVFAVGTLEQMGLPLKPGFDAVMDANMSKVAGVKDSRGIIDDLVKPDGWHGPEAQLAAVIHGFSSQPDVDLSQLSKPSSAVTLKWDDDKIPIQLVPAEFILAIAEVFAHGAEKYGPNNWRQGDVGFPSVTRVMGSILRHLFSFNYGEDNDKKSDLSHLSHAATQIAILLYYLQHGMNEDDRFTTDDIGDRDLPGRDSPGDDEVLPLRDIDGSIRSDYSLHPDLPTDSEG